MPNLFPDFTDFVISVRDNDVAIHGVRSGTGPPLLLLHGFPQTHHIWHKIAPRLAEHFTVIALDLRGYGLSSKPRGTSGKHTEYSKSTMARDCVAVMAGLGFTKDLYVCGHDRGGRVAHKMCVDFPSKVRKVMLLDIAPTKAMYAGTDKFFATAYWHWFFLIQPSPFPENAIFTAPQVFGDQVFSAGSSFFGEECEGIYRRMLVDRDALHGMCEDYRAGATVDIEEATKDEEAGRKIQCDLRVLWAKQGVIAAKFKPLELWSDVCSGVVSGQVVNGGHYIPEHNPDAVFENIMEFFN